MMIKKRYPILSLFILIILASVSLSLLARADVPEARDAALKMFRKNFGGSYFLHPRYYTSTVAEGEEATVRIPIFKGNQYIIAAVGDSGVADVDLYTYDEGGDRWAFDTGDRPFGVVTKRARWTGYVNIRVHAARGAGSICVVTGHR